MSGVWLVAGRELHQAFRGKAFWIGAGALFVASAAGMIVPDVLGESSSRYRVAVVNGTPAFEGSLREVARSLDWHIEVTDTPDPAAARRAVDQGDVDVAAIAGAEPAVVVKSITVDRLVGVVQQALEIDGLAGRLLDRGLSPGDVAEVLDNEPVRVEHRDSGEVERTRQGVAFAVALALYLLLLLLMTQVATGTATEKANRISEVLLAIVRPGTLLAGKVIGVGAVGLLTLLAGVVPVVVKVATGDPPAGTGAAVLGAAPWFVLGAALYLTLAGALGSLVDRPEEVNSAVVPLSTMLIAGIFAAQAADSGLATVLAYVPLTSPLVMPSRIAVGVATPAETALSLAASLVALAVAARAGSTVYRRAIIRTGRRLRLREVLAAG
ncbi:MAG: ABC transporter permease [Acidimicrobiia bacterium]